MPRIPDIVLRPRVPLSPATKPKPTKKKATKRRSRARPTTLAERTEAIIEDLRARYRKAESEFYAIGKALIELNRSEVLALYQAKSFEQFVSTHVLPYRTAARFIRVAREYDAETAQMLGVEKAYQLARRAEQMKQSPQALAKRNAKLAGKRISKLSAREIEDMVSAAAMQAAKKKRPTPTEAEKKSVSAFRKDLVAYFEMQTKVTIDAKDRMVLIAVPLDEVLEEY